MDAVIHFKLKDINIKIDKIVPSMLPDGTPWLTFERDGQHVAGGRDVVSVDLIASND